MKRRSKILRAGLFFAILIAIVAFAAISTFPAIRNMLTPLSERYRREGDTFLANHQLAESVLSYRQAVDADPHNQRALASLSAAYAQQGRLRMAARYQALAGTQSIPTASPQNVASTGQSLLLDWQMQADEAAPTGGTLINGILIAAYEDGRIFAMRSADGKVVWNSRLSAPLTSAPASDDQRVYVGDSANRLHALSLSDGKELWQFSSGGPVYAAPLVAGSDLYCPSSDGTLYALNAADGSVRWKFSAAGGLNGTPALADGIVYFGSNDGKLYALEAAGGAPVWKDGIQTNGAVESQPSVVDGRVIFGSGDSRIYALAVQSGGQYWRFSTTDSIFAHPLVDQGVVFIASSGGTLSAVDFLTGKRVWQADLSVPLRSPPAIDDQRLYQAGEASPDLFVVDRKTGKLMATIPTGDWTGAGPWLDHGRLLLIGKDGAVLAYRLSQ